MISQQYTALLTPEMEAIIADPASLFDLVDREQRLVAISLPEAGAFAAKALTRVFNTYSVESRIFAAHKATNSRSVLSAVKSYTSIDVASSSELTTALSLGYTTAQIVATGPKSTRFLSVIAQHDGITVAVDSVNELQRLIDITSTSHLVQVLLRLSRSMINPLTVHKLSRFGLDHSQFDSAVDLILKSPQLLLRGLAFHLDSQSVDERTHAISTSLSLLSKLQDRGFSDACVLDIGGGFGSQFGLVPADYVRFEDNLKTALLTDRNLPTWQNYSYGLKADGARIRGSLSGISRPRAQTGADELAALLFTETETGVTIADRINESLTELWIEPGATLFADTGMVIAEVIECRHSDGQNLVVVDAHRNQLCFENNEFLADPILIPKTLHEGLENRRESTSAFVVGHLCMESDFISYRSITFDQSPQPGDLLVWTHTGAYRSHFSGSESIGHRLAARYTYSLSTKTYNKE